MLMQKLYIHLWISSIHLWISNNMKMKSKRCYSQKINSALLVFHVFKHSLGNQSRFRAVLFIPLGFLLPTTIPLFYHECVCYGYLFCLVLLFSYCILELFRQCYYVFPFVAFTIFRLWSCAWRLFQKHVVCTKSIYTVLFYKNYV